MGTSDRRPYLSATALNQAFLDECASNLETRVEMIADIEAPDGSTIRASDRNKYVGSTFYEALLEFPVIERTVGEWLSPVLEFSTLTLTLSNADGRFNKFLPGGDDYDSFVGCNVTIKVGIHDISATYSTIFSGKITEVGGVQRNVYSITLIARDKTEDMSVQIPPQVMDESLHADIEEGVLGTTIPIIYGDWTTALEPDLAVVPAYVANGSQAFIEDGIGNVVCLISENDNQFLDINHIYYFSNDTYYQIPPGNITLDSSNRAFFFSQGFDVDGEAYKYKKGDQFFCRVIGKDIGSGLSNNIVAQAKDILLTYGGAVSGDFHANWNTFQTRLSSILSRAHISNRVAAIEYALSLLEQVLLEVFIDKDQKIKINSLQFVDFVPSPSFSVKNWDVIRGTLSPKIDENINFNRAQGLYDYRPNRSEQARASKVFKNNAAIAQSGRAISKTVEYPNLYVQADVEHFIVEMLKISSATIEIVDVNLTWRAMLLDVGDFVSLNVEIGSIIYDGVPAMIRSKGYDPEGVQIQMKLWSCQMLPFSGYEPGYPGTVGGFNGIIIAE